MLYFLLLFFSFFFFFFFFFCRKFNVRRAVSKIISDESEISELRTEFIYHYICLLKGKEFIWPWEHSVSLSDLISLNCKWKFSFCSSNWWPLGNSMGNRGIVDLQRRPLERSLNLILNSRFISNKKKNYCQLTNLKNVFHNQIHFYKLIFQTFSCLSILFFFLQRLFDPQILKLLRISEHWRKHILTYINNILIFINN